VRHPPEPECTHIITDAMIAKMRDVFWAQEHGIVHPDVTVIGGGEEAQP
jgi:hypothetical protein